MPFRRRANLGAWQYSQSAISGAKAAATYSSTNLFSNTGSQYSSSIRALTIDVTGWDSANDHRWRWAVLVLPSGTAVPADWATTSNKYPGYFWCYGGESATTQSGLHIHIDPKTKRRLNVGDTLWLSLYNVDATAAAFNADIIYDYYVKAV